MTPPVQVSPPAPDRLRIAFALYAAVLFEGIMLASIGPTLDALAERSGSKLGRARILFTANALGYITGSLAAGRVYARVRGNPVLAVTLAMMALLTGTVPLLTDLWL